jgi:hypothetical protein
MMSANRSQMHPTWLPAGARRKLARRVEQRRSKGSVCLTDEWWLALSATDHMAIRLVPEATRFELLGSVAFGRPAF